METPIVCRRASRLDAAGKVEIVGFGATHFWLGIPLSDEPCGQAGGHVPDHARSKMAEGHAVDILFQWWTFYTYTHGHS